MLAITVHQPYAQLLAIGVKKFETRGWYTPHRGWIAIHAGKSTEVIDELNDEISDFLDSQLPMSDLTLCTVAALKQSPHTAQINRLSELPRGMIVAVANLAGCHKGDDLFVKGKLTRLEETFGNFDSDDDETRYGWELSEVFCLPRPIRIPGQQKLWTVPEDVVDQIRQQWRAVKKGA